MMHGAAEDQIQTILDEADANLIRACPALAQGAKAEDFTFNMVFQVQLVDVVNHVEKHGWNPRFVREAECAPVGDPDCVGTIFIVPGQDAVGYQVVVPEERGQVEVWATLPDMHAARRYVAKVMMRRQWARWNMRFLKKRPELRAPGQKLLEIFKLPVGMTQADFAD